nr:MAG TPA: hypothetical protein [Caudoviricetes sp.]
MAFFIFHSQACNSIGQVLVALAFLLAVVL